ncbi:MULTISPECIES: hypothetical protein [unclassified Streptomyces]|uniref:hypothetical protein n=1 Tax=unclassified Streptomyces TaxID=2593676 RepID=UPI002E30C8E0|nr:MULTISPECIES: hypothetical protein [unclassified Streptomyces]WUC67733.1 hypothetical protein OG861_27855 [Streptomyces sp. NBC_00539]
MQLRRAALPLSLLALLASAGCVSVGPGEPAAGPARGSLPPVDAPDAPPVLPPSEPLPLSPLPDPGPAPDAAPDPGPEAEGQPKGKTRVHPARRGGEHAAKPAAPRRVRPPDAPRRTVPRGRGGEELCAAAEGVVPPSVVDLCVRQYDR